MKRLLCLMLVMCLLCGCVQTPAEDTKVETEPVTEAPTEPGIYDPENPVETQTGGAVKAYVTELDDCTGILTMGESLLLFRGESLTLLTGQQLTEFTTEQIPNLPAPSTGLVQARADGVAYYDAEENSIVFLGSSLKETARLHLSEEVVGGVYLSPDWQMAYYCTETDVRALDMQTGISRLLKDHGGVKKTVTGVFLNGTAIRCRALQEDGTEKTVLLSAKNGEQLYEGDALESLQSGEAWYCLQMLDCSVPELMIGKEKNEAKCIWPAGAPEQYWVNYNCDGMVTARTEKETLILDQYDFETGLRSATVTIQALTAVKEVTVSAGGKVWLRGAEGVYCWSPENSPAEDEAVYAADRYKPERPDENGIAAAQEAAKELEKRYGVDLLLHTEADGVTPWDYRFETEYLGLAFEKAIAQLETIMAKFPDTFFAVAAEKSANKKLSIVLVRGIYGAPEDGTLESAPGVQYWLDGKAYIALTMGETLERYFYHEMGHVIDTVVLSKSKYFYEWDKYNPSGFEYDNDYIANLDREDHQYLKKADRWFIDMYSMSYAVEDRSRIFEYACFEGNEEYFQSPNLLKKYKQVCTGIRRAFGLRKDPNTFLWEQYLPQ